MEYPEMIEQVVRDHKYTAKRIYTDRFGNAWYAFTDPLRIPGARSLAAELAATWCELNMTKEDILTYMRNIRSSANKGDFVRACRLIDCMEERVEWACEDKSLLGLAKVYFTINDEPLNAPTEAHTMLKDEVFANDSECRAFFLLRAHVLTKASSEFSPADILNYSKAMHAKEVRAFGKL